MSTTSLLLPRADGSLAEHRLSEPGPYPSTAAPSRRRVAYAAAHVVADPLADTTPVGPPAIDWEATLSYRRHLWGLGLGVAEAMDTAQRGMGLDWPLARELIRRTGEEAASTGGRLVAGAGTDQLAPGSARSLGEVVDAYAEQCAAVESAGATAAVMASRELCRIARSPEDYAEVYGAVLSGLEHPAIVHWLGEVFDPSLAGYFGGASYEEAAGSLLAILSENASKVEGLKCSLLDQEKEVELRRQLPPGVRMYTGDDFDYPTTISGDGERHSDALLGAFDFITAPAAAALHALDEGDATVFAERLAPTLPLSRQVFAAPTFYYKTGVVFLAYLNGFQAHFKMVGGLESGRSVLHLSEVLRLADAAGLLRDPELAAARMRHLLALAGIEG